MNRMSRNRRTAKTPSSRQHGGTLIGLFIGMVIGLLCAFGVAWYLQKSPLPFQNTEMQERVDTTQPAGAPLQLPGKPGQKPVNGGKNEDTARFEFYKILPSGQMTPTPASTALPSSAGNDDDGGNAANAATTESSALYLQVGAFQKSADANNQKAKLALMGFETSVFEAETADRGTLYRVRIGPFASLEEMNLARNQLSEGGVPATVVKIKNPTTPQQ